jgi:hypothetical protein
MGGFQAVASGLGEAGEQAGQGVNEALNAALKVRQQDFVEKNAANEIALRYAQLHQQGSLESQRNDILHQQIIGQGWKDQGLSVDNNGGYQRTYYNDQTKETRVVPMNGTPPDSPQAHLDTYKMLTEQGFDPTKAQEIAFKMGNLYRTDPVGIAQEWQDRAKELSDSGVKSVPIIGYGNVDISTPQGQAKYAQIMADSNTRGISAMYRAMYGNGSGVGPGHDLSGFTPGEAREFKAFEMAQQSRMAAREKFGTAALANTMPQDIEARTKGLMDASDQDTKAIQDKYNEIYNRRSWSVSKFMQANPHATPAQINQAKQQAKAANKRIDD